MEQEFGLDAVGEYNALVKRAKAGRNLTLLYPGLVIDTLRIRASPDVSLDGDTDLSSPVRFVVLLCYTSGRRHVLSYGSDTCKGVVRSAMAAEIYALTAALD